MHVQFPVEGNSNSEVDLQSLPPIEEDMEFGQDLSLDSSSASSPDPPRFSLITSDDDRSMYDINLPDSFNDDHMDVDVVGGWDSRLLETM